MKTFIVNLCITLFLLVGYESCLHTPQELPPITTEGKGTFGCKVNGAIYLPQGQYSGWGIYNTSTTDTAKLHIYASNRNGSINIVIYDTTTIVTGKTYHLSNQKYHLGYYAMIHPLCEYDTISSGSLTILKYDIVNNIIAGTFDFNTVPITSSCNPVQITEGRFDWGGNN